MLAAHKARLEVLPASGYHLPWPPQRPPADLVVSQHMIIPVAVLMLWRDQVRATLIQVCPAL